MRETVTPLTGPQMNALRALADLTVPRPVDSPGYVRKATPKQVAKALWPDSPAWQQRTRFGAVGNQGAVGGTMPMKAATVLWRLHARGLAEHDPDWGWFVTDRGHGVLAGSADPLPAPPVQRRTAHVGGGVKPPRTTR